MAAADDLIQTEDERDALARLRDLTGESDGPMERHSTRCFLLAEKLAADGNKEIDREVLLIAAWIHDLGLYEGASEGGAYVTDGRHYAERMLAGKPGWDDARIRLCGDAIERHHELRSQWEAGNEVELLRRADRIELGGGLIRYGIPRAWFKDLDGRVRRDGTYREIGKLVARGLRQRPLTMAQIFVRGKGT